MTVLACLLASSLTAAAMAPVGSADAHGSLLAWAHHHGAVLGPVRICASGCGPGIGMYAERNVENGEVLFCLPHSLHVTLATACGNAVCGASFAAAASRGQAMGVVASCIAKVHICGGSEIFAPYAPTLPLSPSAEHVIWWSEEQLALLEGTSAHPEAHDLRAEAEAAVAAALRCRPLRRLVRRALNRRQWQRAGLEPSWKRLDHALSRAVPHIIGGAAARHSGAYPATTGDGGCIWQYGLAARADCADGCRGHG